VKLEYKDDYISIEQFNSIELPDFTVITGPNGAGKSHLLAAIKNRKAVLVGLRGDSIVLFNYQSFRLDNETAFTGQKIAESREAAWKSLKVMQPQLLRLRESIEAQYVELKEKCSIEGKNFLDLEEIISYKQKVTRFFNNSNRKNQPEIRGIYSLLKKIPYAIDEMNEDEFKKIYQPYTFKDDFLPSQLGKIFWDYYVKYRTNQINAFENIRNDKDYEVFTENEFIRLHGDKPWDVVNRILNSFETLQYEVESPEGYDYFGSFQLKLKHIEKDNIEIPFSSLSSGEKALMALVASVYKASSDGHFPDVLLLDEVDASLHPSMMKNMLAVIEEVFLEQGVKVIMVTHSPTTIAIAPENSIHIMNKSGLNRIEKKSRSEALEVLTEGFATLDQGIKLLDEIAKSNITIITEGKNTILIKLALELYGIHDVEVVTGIEGSSGKTQLNTLFDFFSKVPHNNKVIIVWDCDVNNQFSETNNTFPFIFLSK